MSAGNAELGIAQTRAKVSDNRNQQIKVRTKVVAKYPHENAARAMEVVGN